MITTHTTNSRAPRITPLLMLSVATVIVAGCHVVFDGPPKPPPVWHSADPVAIAKIDKMAVIVQDMTHKLNGEGPIHAVEDRFIESLIGKGYRVADRSDVAQVFNEIRFQHDGLTESDAARLGKMLNVPAVLLVSINDINPELDQYMAQGRYGTFYNVRYTISVRLVSVEKAEILGITSYTDISQETDSYSYSTLPLIAEEVASVIPPRTN